MLVQAFNAIGRPHAKRGFSLPLPHSHRSASCPDSRCNLDQFRDAVNEQDLSWSGHFHFTPDAVFFSSRNAFQLASHQPTDHTQAILVEWQNMRRYMIIDRLYCFERHRVDVHQQIYQTQSDLAIQFVIIVSARAAISLVFINNFVEERLSSAWLPRMKDRC